ncbi:MAG: maleylpyruvate isomerase family mycothiol-dependent enzyme [bacterium]|nr:maleylpyruvate isomerase family mycothiol-dependent enzyme [bacterium]
MPTFDELLAHLDADSHLFAAAASRGLEPDVPCCPGWTVRDLVTHMGEVISQKADLVAGGWADSWPVRNEQPEGLDPLVWYRKEAARLYEVLAAADPAAPAATFGRDKTVAFWFRRMAHETLVHRVDAEQAHGYESTVDPELAVDGVAELFDVFATGYPKWASFRPSADLVRVETAERSWAVRLGESFGTKDGRDYNKPTSILEPEGEPITVISGEPDRVMLWMWGRAPIEQLTVAGDLDAAERFRRVCVR